MQWAWLNLNSKKKLFCDKIFFKEITLYCKLFKLWGILVLRFNCTL